MKDYLSNKKYFTQKSPIPQHVIFVGECVVAFVLFMLDAWFWPISFAIFIVGSIIEVVLTSKYISDKYFESLNGNITVVLGKDGVNVICSASDLKLKETDWFKENRTTPDAWK